MADIKGFFAKTLPGMALTVASGIPGPVGAVASIIGKVVGKSDLSSDPNDIAAAVAGATPDQLLELRKADQDFQLQMQQLGFANMKDMEALAVEDRDSARKREMAIRDFTPEIGFYMLAGIFAYALHWVFRYPIPQDNKALCYTMLGSLGTLLVTAATYFYGTTRGSEAKTALLAQAPPINGNGVKK